MCFAPQRRALFRHLNFQKRSERGVFCKFWIGNMLRATTACTFFRHLNCQKWSGCGVFCTFWLRHVLRATTACTFSTAQLPKVVRTCGALCILTWTCASTTACNFSSLIWPASSAPAALASLLFDPPEPQIIGKNRMFRDFPTFSRILLFLFYSSLF